MTLENMIRAIAGTFVTLSLALGYIYSPYWHLFTAFVGLNLFQSAFTHWCLMEKILLRLGIARTSVSAREVTAPAAAPPFQLPTAGTEKAPTHPDASSMH